MLCGVGRSGGGYNRDRCAREVVEFELLDDVIAFILPGDCPYGWALWAWRQFAEQLPRGFPDFGPLFFPISFARRKLNWRRDFSMG